MPRALLSVYDKTGIADFARELRSLGWELLSSGGTAKVLRESGVEVTDVSTVTGYPAILGHRVVTLHPAVHGGLLANLDDPDHLADLRKHGIEPIALAVVNLYPFGGDPSVELIDVGGPAMVRAAAKNHRHVGVVTDTSQYQGVIDELRRHGRLSDETRRTLAAQAFAGTAEYDARIAEWLAGDKGSLPARITLQLEHEAPLRYGENPHQEAARYRIVGERSWWATAEQLGGKEMSYLNEFDADAAWSLVNRFSEPAAVVVKHANPCGVAVADDIETAYELALESDRLSAFGGIVALNRTMTRAVAETLTTVFTEVVVAPDYEPGALGVLAAKKNLRILRARTPFGDGWSMRKIDGAMLVQTYDEPGADTSSWRVMSSAQPTGTQLRDAVVAWVACAATSSNAIVLVSNGGTVGIGAGQQNRVDAARIACARAGNRARGAVAASDAFFPFRDGVDALAAAGVAVIVQPGGSQRDDEAVAAANEHGMVMLFTDKRHFRH